MFRISHIKSRALTALALVGILTGASAMATDIETKGPVTLINAFEVPVDQVDATVAFWEKSRDFLKEQPGYISTRLHQALAPDAKFQLINVARWESPEAFQAAIRKMREGLQLPEGRGPVFHSALYRVIRTDED
ncbi:antibiotic biosynthesis monooxygenase family protein [Roseibium sp.]|uniref:antibiotic biosynthesis monooxygenase family protein n=1 Tax=Roseibium sp. TaxID=1936156 RepID=UPI003B50F197